MFVVRLAVFPPRLKPPLSGVLTAGLKPRPFKANACEGADFFRLRANGPGLKPDCCVAVFRSLKATAPSVSLTLKRQGTRCALWDDTSWICTSKRKPGTDERLTGGCGETIRI